MKTFILLCIGIAVEADVYLHNPRGSNNRYNAGGRDVTNQARLFDSENNARGGYNVGNLYYYEGTELEFEWTNQHSCGDENNNCEIILQYMCGPLVRDGVTRSTPASGNVCKTTRNCNTYLETGMHEDYDYYLRCKKRNRNNGLFTADQNLDGDDARYTRQNANGDRNGYECPEERDYYPYWHPTPWKDIAVMTNDISSCPYYERESENVKGRGHCVFSEEFLLQHSSFGRFKNLPNNQVECESYVYTDKSNGKPFVDYSPTWVEEASHGIPAPDCFQSPWSRDNHNGNGIGGYHNTYRWTIPSYKAGEEKCVFRIRYNISTNDYDSWAETADNNSPSLGYFTNENDATARGYVYANNPTVQIFPGINLDLNLAINTAQFGRTFQDRTHVFTIKKRTNALKDKVIHNVNVRGKRGNLQQVYPATEYDFVPNTLHVNTDEYIHFQWTGSDTNPNNNAGNGRAGTDRSNIVLLASKPYGNADNQQSHLARNYPALLDTSTFLGFSLWNRRNLATLENGGHYGGSNGPQLDEAGTYVDFGPLKATTAGVYNYMSTRNNAFTNRCQKAQIVVS